MGNELKAKCNPSIINSPRILVISHMYPSDKFPTSGIFVHEQVKELRKRGLDARVLAGYGICFSFRDIKSCIVNLLRWLGFTISKWDRYDDVPVIRIPFLAIPRFTFYSYSSSYVMSVLRFHKKIKKTFDFNIIHAHTSFLDGSVAKVLAKKYKLPFVITEHTGPFSILTKNIFLRKKTTSVIKAANKIITVSPFMLQDIIRETKLDLITSACIIPNLVDTKQFYYINQKNNQSEQINILWVGHFVPVKKVTLLINAFNMLLKQKTSSTNLRLKLVGDGDEKLKIEKLAEELGILSQIDFLGRASREELNVYYNNSDFLVVSSEVETFSVVTIEAMSCGLPVLSTKCGGPESIIVNKNLGLLVDKNEFSLMEGMNEMIKNLEFFDRKTIRNYIFENFSEEVVSNKIKKEYLSLLDSN